MPHFIVFDLDGTLLNTLPDIAGAMNRVLSHFHLPQHGEDSYKIFTGNGARVLTRRALGGRTDMEDQVYPAYLQEYSRHSREKTRPYEGIPEVLHALSREKIQLIVYSNKDDPETRDVVRHYFPDIRFAAVRGSLIDMPLKPDPAALNEILSSLQLKPEDGLYVGDTIMDMQCAKAVGISAVAALWGFQSEKDLRSQDPEYLIERPEQLPALADSQFHIAP